jgi:hypothetical protein
VTYLKAETQPWLSFCFSAARRLKPLPHEGRGWTLAFVARTLFANAAPSKNKKKSIVGIGCYK